MCTPNAFSSAVTLAHKSSCARFVLYIAATTALAALISNEGGRVACQVAWLRTLQPAAQTASPSSDTTSACSMRRLRCCSSTGSALCMAALQRRVPCDHIPLGSVQRSMLRGVWHCT